MWRLFRIQFFIEITAGKQSHLFSMLTRIINTFGYREEFLNDERMLKFWIKLTENKSDANIDTFFERAYIAGCCRRLAKFYVRWAEVGILFLSILAISSQLFLPINLAVVLQTRYKKVSTVIYLH